MLCCGKQLRIVLLEVFQSNNFKLQFFLNNIIFLGTNFIISNKLERLSNDFFAEYPLREKLCPRGTNRRRQRYKAYAAYWF